MLLLKIFKIFTLLFLAAYGLKIIPESMKMTYINEKFLTGVVANIRRYSRNGDYYFNFRAVNKETWANNVSVSIIITQYLHNEYRRSFIEFHYRFCDLVNKEPMFGQMLKEKGVVCPALKGEYRLMNMTIQSQNFPNVWPFEKGGADINVTVADTGEVIGMAYVHMQFKNFQKKGPKQ